MMITFITIFCGFGVLYYFTYGSNLEKIIT
jgi:hypothetical protein